MKKSILILLTAVLALSVAGCGKTATAEPEKDPGPMPAEAEMEGLSPEERKAYIELQYTMYRLREAGYRESAITAVVNTLSSGQIEWLLGQKPRKYLEGLVLDPEFQTEKLEDYVRYIDRISTSYQISGAVYLVNHGIDYPYSEKLVTVVRDPYYIESRFSRYMAYSGKDLSRIVTEVNANRDRDYYTETKKADLSQGYNLLVNKYYYLDSDYAPDDIVKISLSYSYSGNSCSKVVLDAFIEMYKEAMKEDIQLIVNSSYRSYESQDSVWSQRKKKSGIEAADNYAARAGFSEHQTGLALDLDRYNSKDSDEAYAWLARNAYRFGFILRYPEGKEDITGYKYEAWHYRYVGKETAKYIFEHDITLEEYYAYFIEK